MEFGNKSRVIPDCGLLALRAFPLLCFHNATRPDIRRGKNIEMKLEKASWICGVLTIPIAFFVWYFKPEDFNAFFKSLGRIIWTPFSIAYNWLALPACWPHWALILLAFSGLAIFLGLFYIFGRANRSETQPIQFDPFDYKADEVFGID